MADMEWRPLGAGVPACRKGDIEHNLASDWSPAGDPRLDQRLGAVNGKFVCKSLSGISEAKLRHFFFPF